MGSLPRSIQVKPLSEVTATFSSPTFAVVPPPSAMPCRPSRKAIDWAPAPARELNGKVMDPQVRP